MRQKLRSLPFFVILLTTQAAVGASPKIALRAHRSQLTVWTVEFNDEGAHRCALVASGPDLSETRRRALSGAECAYLRKLAESARAELAAGARSRPPGPTSDEPHYELLLGDKTAAVRFQAPEDCELRDDGSRHCMKNKLSASQRLLLKLREFGQSLSPSR